MCDTLGFCDSKGIFFAKNSDRSPNEPQILQSFPACKCENKTVKATYIEVEEAPEHFATLLSSPTWMFGAEMGVNECGVCIGNEAVFTKGGYGADALTGMDMVRLALERSGTAKDAMQTIVDLLEKYGQGGNCGFDHDFHYDNSFLIMDRGDLYALQTCGKKWVYKKARRASISNRLSIGEDGDMYSDGRCDFKKQNDPVYTYFSGSAQREQRTSLALRRVPTEKNLFRVLRSHESSDLNPFAKGSVRSVCMHAGGIVGDHTTASMVVNMNGKRPVVWATGSSTPCISVFKPYLFGSRPTAPVFSAAAEEEAKRYWLTRERFARSLIGKELPKAFYVERDEVEAALLEKASRIPRDEESYAALSKWANTLETAFYKKWSLADLPDAKTGPRFRAYWANKNKALEE